jgi:lysophospholipase-2
MLFCTDPFPFLCFVHSVFSWSQLLDSLSLPNIKWICPTAATQPVTAFGGFPCTAWFDVEDTSVDGRDDIEGLDASAAHIANLLSSEPPDGTSSRTTSM